MSMTTPGTAIQDRGPVVLAVTVAFLGVSTLFVALRLVSRIGIVKRVTADDYFIVFAWVCAAANPALFNGLTLTRDSSWLSASLFPYTGEYTMGSVITKRTYRWRVKLRSESRNMPFPSYMYETISLRWSHFTDTRLRIRFLWLPRPRY